MTRKEAVTHAIRHESMGKVPYAIYFAADAQEKYFSELYRRSTDNKMQRAVEKGLLTMEEAISIGIGNHVLRIYPPWWDWYNVPEEYKKSFCPPSYLPKTIGYGSYGQLVDKLKFISDTVDCYVLAAFYGSHFEKAYFARGIENFLADMAGDPDYARGLLNKIIDRNMVMIENILYLSGIDGVMLGSDWGSQKSLLMSPKSWRELIAPGEKKEYDLIRQGGKDIWVHSCGCIEEIIPDLVEMGLDVLNPIQPECMDIYGLKARFGSKLAFWGGVSTQRTLPYGTPDEVRSETISTITAMGRGGGYIAAPAQEIQADVPLKNIEALIQAACSLA